uniref:MLV-related proviral Env polyprotein-like isoform X1 n=1 Tax=Jaculus jaculus TaxID=51337 RepID=UPI001E1B2372|nr:MLV-related proviral Env polyprotein-like isoform X1 [Jaculus jaculus]XP_045010431.1 MLV-related proviral Env polyprotein-like isoform X1 [Jaculus jaculus]XP_045010432.1 MLV-related proviral Env polyprotein-like isoform X1 [Jaculus jaculus]XP_045010433.1 MLV-related proviral Env polyprotein-like isoform X1 [Jaculus jaculus]XP_045010434.1 MLV-related proviral Env polyprotein-like isoform X1 [Jaculus jaculus]XP_045010435.1 MLV-related proviral Env polyprotein-like isoform X1 [Jaculus jaculus]
MKRSLHRTDDHSHGCEGGRHRIMDPLDPCKDSPLESWRVLNESPRPKGSTQALPQLRCCTPGLNLLMLLTACCSLPQVKNASPVVSPLKCPSRTQAYTLLTLVLFTTCAYCGPLSPSNPHQPVNLTWVITDFSTGDILVQKSKIAPVNTWFPDLQFDLSELLPEKSHWSLKHTYFYVCPGRPQAGQTDKDWRKQCGEAHELFCRSWSCVSTGDLYWTAPVKTDLIQVKRNDPPDVYIRGRRIRACSGATSNTCNPIQVRFTKRGKQDSTWEAGKMWGLSTHPSGSSGLFTIKLLSRPLHSPYLGPNKALAAPWSAHKPAVATPLLPTTKPVPSTLAPPRKLT